MHVGKTVLLEHPGNRCGAGEKYSFHVSRKSTFRKDPDYDRHRIRPAIQSGRFEVFMLHALSRHLGYMFQAYKDC